MSSKRRAPSYLDNWGPRDKRPYVNGVSKSFADGGNGCRLFKKCYKKHEIMGKGTFGEVFKAQDLSNGETVAVKQIKIDKGYEVKGISTTALREIMILKTLTHENIVELKEIVVDSEYIDLGNKSNGFYIVMGFMDHDLGGLLKSRAVKFNLSHVMNLSKQILSGLFYLHSLNILHRDMKAANVLLSKSGQLRLTDFGLARYLDPTRTSKYTPENVVTRWYRPPEILLGSNDYDSAVDTWGAGCIIAELVIGNPIFQVSNGEVEAESDIKQYLKIVEICGDMVKEEWSPLSICEKTPRGIFKHDLGQKSFMLPKVPQKRRLKEVLGGRLKRKYAQMFPDEPAHKASMGALLDLLDGLLIMSPLKRLRAEQALLAKFFFQKDLPPATNNEIPLPGSMCHDYTVAKNLQNNIRSRQAPHSKR